MGISCKSKTAIAVLNSTQDSRRNNGGVLESFKGSELEVATNWFARENLIVKASHGDMYRGILHDGRVVAVKRPDAGARWHEDAEAFNNEVQILSKLFSRRLVNLLGCSQDGRVKLLVLEYMANGPLHENLLAPFPVAAMESTSAAVPLSWPVRVKLALDVAKAVRALHASSPPIIHRNIKSTNVFIDRGGNARLGDFCLAKCLQEAEPPRRSVLISIPEIIATKSETDCGQHSGDHSVGLEDFDPEHFQDSSSSSAPEPHISPKTDVFSVGIILLEIMSGRSAHDADHRVGSLPLLDWALPLIKHGNSTAICDPRLTPTPDIAAVRLMANVAARCVRSASTRRPSMEEVVHCLTKATKLIPEPVLTTTTTNARDPKPVERLPGYKERLIPISTPDPTTRLNMRSSLWTGFSSLTTKRTLGFRLSRFFAGKLRIGARSRCRYDKLDQKMNSKVSDDSLRERSAVDHKTRRRVPPTTRASGSSSRRAGTKFVRS